jgi:hypothetical protein
MDSRSAYSMRLTVGGGNSYSPKGAGAAASSSAGGAKRTSFAGFPTGTDIGKVKKAVDALRKESELNFRLESETADATNHLYTQVRRPCMRVFAKARVITKKKKKKKPGVRPHAGWGTILPSSFRLSNTHSFSSFLPSFFVSPQLQVSALQRGFSSLADAVIEELEAVREESQQWPDERARW